MLEFMKTILYKGTSTTNAAFTRLYHTELAQQLARCACLFSISLRFSSKKYEYNYQTNLRHAAYEEGVTQDILKHTISQADANVDDSIAGTTPSFTVDASFRSSRRRQTASPVACSRFSQRKRHSVSIVCGYFVKNEIYNMMMSCFLRVVTSPLENSLISSA